jgi:hypothetical protein
VTDNARELLLPLNALLEANDRLNAAITATRKRWDVPARCWIDQISEPTKLLADHRLKGKSDEVAS